MKMFRSYQIVLHITMLTIFFKTSAFFNKSPPRILKQPPADILMFEVDKSFLLECEAEGEPAPEYRWTKNGRNFEWQTKNYTFLQTHGTLNFSEATNEDEGQYQCFATNTFGTATSNSVMVVQKYKYTIGNDRESNIELTVYEGEPLNITCNPIPIGRPKPDFDWIAEDEDGKLREIINSRITMDPNGVLWFSYVTMSDSNLTYWFIPNLEPSKVSDQILRCPTKLKVKQVKTGLEYFPPELQYVTPKYEKVLLGEEIELFCIYSGNPAPEIVWLKNESTMILSDDNDEITNYDNSLLIQSVTIEDKGTYTCNASNYIGFKLYSIELDVMVKPYFKNAPKIAEKVIGETAVIECSASGNPEPTIMWIHNGRPLLNETRLNPRRSVTSNTIIITALTKNDTGNYGCNATNSVGYVYQDIYINVFDSSLDFHEYKAVIGKSVTIGCTLFEDSKPYIKWSKNNEGLSNARYSILDSGGLHIRGVDFNDTGDYICHFNNNNNESEFITKKLIVEDPTFIFSLPDEVNAKSKPQDKPQTSRNFFNQEWLIGVLTVVIFFVILGITIRVIKYNKQKVNKVERYEILYNPPSTSGITDV